jgi:hypothetical protein
VTVHERDTFTHGPGAGAGTLGTLPRTLGAFGPIVTNVHETRSFLGWTLGGGGEWRLNEMISISTEYRYTDLGSRRFTFSDYSFLTSLTNEGLSVPTIDGLGPAPPDGRPHVGPAETKIGLNDHQIGLRLNVRLNSFLP